MKRTNATTKRGPTGGRRNDNSSKPDKKMAKMQRAVEQGASITASGPRFHSINPPRAGSRYSKAELELGVDDLSSDDEAPKNTIGNVPTEWYKDYDHIGYDLSGKQISRSKRLDGIDRFLASQDDPLFKWTIYDEVNDEEFVLSKRDVQMLQRIRAGTYGHPGFDAYPDAPDLLEKEIHPLDSGTAPKGRFLPSKWERLRVNRIVKAIQEGTFKGGKRSALEREAASRAYLLWGEDDKAIGYKERKYAPPPLPAPKLPPPGHAASYNPPPEYLLTPEEEAAWQKTDPADRLTDFLPKRFTSLRHVPLYSAGLRERFERCLDLYLCPRAASKRPDVDPDSLLPALPDASQLRPYPTASALRFTGHVGRVRAVCFDTTGRHIASGGDDGNVKLWETATGRCLRTWAMGGVVQTVAFNPDPTLCLLAVACEEFVHVVYTGTATKANAGSTYSALAAAAEAIGQSSGDRLQKRAASDEEEEDDDEGKEKGNDSTKGLAASVALREARWIVSAHAASSAEDLLPSPSRMSQAHWTGIQISIAHAYPVRSLAWHRKGDYIAVATPSAPTGQVMLHAFTKGRSQCPFKKNVGQVQAVAWHPSKPLLYVANQRTLRVYDLVQGAMVQKLESGVKWISCLDIHPSGDHVIAGSYDHRVVWFDTELGNTPYKTLRYHGSGVRRAGFHSRYPLMATGSDDGTVHIFHTRVFNDFLQNPVIVPVKILKGHTVGADGLGVLDAAWHPTQPWLLSAGADGVMHLWHNVP